MIDNAPIATDIATQENTSALNAVANRARARVIKLQQQRQEVQEQIQQLKAQNEEIEAALYQSYQTLEYQQSLQKKAKALKPQTYQTDQRPFNPPLHGQHQTACKRPC
ncbi:hypothetical protein NHP190002_13000 [Helicobacter ailurogastricus]|uniref:hypothetical protein n=1 Tax=Helicobacter ailurogastricus TaxID=1578720 RepID=UPI00244D8B81|nr:hypothetical protein [Helicobacter ailurogastricus]GMB90596.1 hypothetical protein NHP190002_13000 [Helicobacter ailurogastricus]